MSTLIADHYAKKFLALFEKHKFYPDFGWEGETGFGLLWVLRQMAGIRYPFGEVLCFAAGEYQNQYIAVFSRKTIRQIEEHGLCFQKTEPCLHPGLIIQDMSFSLEWVSSSLEYGNFYSRYGKYNEMPRAAQGRMMELLGEDYPLSLQARKMIGDVL